MKANAKSMASFNASQDQARRRRNRSITLVLVGIIALFLVCHTGEVAVSIYEVRPCPFIRILWDFIQILLGNYLHDTIDSVLTKGHNKYFVAILLLV